MHEEKEEEEEEKGEKSYSRQVRGGEEVGEAGASPLSLSLCYSYML